MTRSILRVPFLMLTLSLIGVTFLLPPTAAAQSSLLSRPALLKVYWFGPFGISSNDTARFNYTNLGADPVMIEWAFTNALTGELVCGNFGKPQKVGVGKGAIWDYQQTLSIDPATGKVTETRICDNQSQVTDELYFDATLRHDLVAWIFIQHESPRGVRNAVDLPAVQLFDSMVLPASACRSAGNFPPDPCRSATFGRTTTFIQANPAAPTEFPRALLGAQGRD